MWRNRLTFHPEFMSRFEQYPKGDVANPEACKLIKESKRNINTQLEVLDKNAIDLMKPGEAVIIFTPDSMSMICKICCISDPGIVLAGTHFPIAMYAIEHGLHVLVTKPATQLLSHHNTLIDAAKKHNVICFVEHHKRQ